MVFQSYALLPHYNIFDNVAYGLKLRHMDKATIKEKVTNILKLVGLEGMEARMTNQLSGGQQQRVALARALVLEHGNWFKHGYRNVIVVKKLTFPNAKLLTIEMTELQISGRNISLNIDYEDGL